MYLLKRLKRIINSRILKKWGQPSTIKAIWNEEFSGGQWDFLENTIDDEIYFYLKKYLNDGSILDLGCGSGNTGNEMDFSKYCSYTGVDISEIAIQRAITRSIRNRRLRENEYFCEDISLFVPWMYYDVILFRESLFYIPEHRIKSVLDRYSKYLKDNGVFIARMCDQTKHGAIVRLIEKHYQVLDRAFPGDTNIILVFK